MGGDHSPAPVGVRASAIICHIPSTRLATRPGMSTLHESDGRATETVVLVISASFFRIVPRMVWTGDMTDCPRQLGVESSGGAIPPCLPRDDLLQPVEEMSLRSETDDPADFFTLREDRKSTSLNSSHG